MDVYRDCQEFGAVKDNMKMHNYNYLPDIKPISHRG